MVLLTGYDRNAGGSSNDLESHKKEQLEMKLRIFTRITLLAAIAAIGTASVIGQYKGDPVKRDRLIKVLRSKQFQTKDIVQIINENGVDFRLDAAAESELRAAGARPLVINAVRRNFRGGNRSAASVRGGNVRNDQYGTLLEQAVEAYDIKRDYKTARQLLTQAALSQPNNPRAYQLLAFLSLYGEKDFDEAEKS